MKKVLLLIAVLLLWTNVGEASDRKLKKLRKVMRRNATRCIGVKRKKNRVVCKTKNKKSRDKSVGYCYRYVKLGLLSAGYVSKYLRGVYARDAGKYLRQEGYTNRIKKYPTPESAPLASVLVYSGGPFGHIEIKLGDKEYGSDYIGDKPVYDFHNLDRTLVGVYVK